MKYGCRFIFDCSGIAKQSQDVRSALPSATAPSVLPRVIWIDMTGRLMSDYEVTLVNDNSKILGVGPESEKII